LESRPITRSELSGLILEMAAVLERMEAYLLPEEQILLEPEYIYIEPESFRVSFCLVPGSRRNFPQAVGQLLQFLLGNVDHQDKECVVLIYGLYQESQKDNYGMEDLLRLLGRPGEGVPVPKTDTAGGQFEQSIGGKQKTAADDVRPLPSERKSTGWKGWGKKLFKPRMAAKESVKESVNDWQAFFEEADDTTIRKPQLCEIEPTTMLLAENKEAPPGYYLQAMQPETPDIGITEFPFIIGKQSSLADFVLDKDTVSRLHVKIDEISGSFRITDLNSTNGTRVRGRLLENNETEQLNAGDEVQIAEWRFRFVAGH